VQAPFTKENHRFKVLIEESDFNPSRETMTYIDNSKPKIETTQDEDKPIASSKAKLLKRTSCRAYYKETTHLQSRKSEKNICLLKQLPQPLIPFRKRRGAAFTSNATAPRLPARLESMYKGNMKTEGASYIRNPTKGATFKAC
jgi:hypothetical protein